MAHVLLAAKFQLVYQPNSSARGLFARWLLLSLKLSADAGPTRAEVLAHLVVAAVFKTVARRVNRVVGGFDSHALPPFSALANNTPERATKKRQQDWPESQLVLPLVFALTRGERILPTSRGRVPPNPS